MTIPSDPAEGWTERQRQVLDLIVKGRSNSEIAEQLGLSIDGAKWHMREILSKLGVESRTEAAEYWRKRNGLPSRFARATRALFAAPVGKVTLSVLGISALVVAALFVVVALRGGGDDPAAIPDNTPGTTPTAATVTPAPSATTTPGSSMTPVPSVFIVNGREIPLTTARVLPDEPPKNISLVMTHGCFYCDQPDTTIERTWWDNDGNESTEVLFDAKDRGGSYLTSIATGPDGSRMVVGLCVRAYCGPLGEYQDEARVQLWESFDYGSSWNQIGQFDGQLYPLGFVGDDLIVAKFVRSGAGFDHDLMNWDTGERIVWPDWDGDRPRPSATARGVLWVYEKKVLDEQFHSVQLELPARPDNIVTGLQSPLYGAFTWGDESFLPAGGIALSAWRADGTVAGALLLPSVRFWRMTWAGGYRFAGSMTWPDIGQLPTIVDIVTGEVRPIRAPFETRAKENDRNVVLAAQFGPFARVNTPGDCLNLRAQPSPTSEILGCIGDGALLSVPGGDNPNMLSVDMGGRHGFVALEFVEFPAKAR